MAGPLGRGGPDVPGPGRPGVGLRGGAGREAGLGCGRCRRQLRRRDRRRPGETRGGQRPRSGGALCGAGAGVSPCPSGPSGAGRRVRSLYSPGSRVGVGGRLPGDRLRGDEAGRHGGGVRVGVGRGGFTDRQSGEGRCVGFGAARPGDRPAARDGGGARPRRSLRRSVPAPAWTCACSPTTAAGSGTLPSWANSPAGPVSPAEPISPYAPPPRGLERGRPKRGDGAGDVPVGGRGSAAESGSEQDVRAAVSEVGEREQSLPARAQAPPPDAELPAMLAEFGGQEAQGRTGHVDAGRADKHTKPLVEMVPLGRKPFYQGLHLSVSPTDLLSRQVGKGSLPM